MKDDVFDGAARDAWVVKDAAYDNRIVRRIVVPEAAAGEVPAPRKLRASHESVKEAAVEVFENFFEMIIVAASGTDVLASAHLADESCFDDDIVAADVAAVTCAVRAIDRLHQYVDRPQR